MKRSNSVLLRRAELRFKKGSCKPYHRANGRIKFTRTR